MKRERFASRMRSRVGHELLLLPSVTVIHFDPQGRMLLLRHRDTGVWVAPGGAIEPDETPADAAVREMWEETGLFVRLTRILGVFGGPAFRVSYANGDLCSYIMTVFESETVNGTLAERTAEAHELRYVGRDELDALDLAPWARVVLPPVFARDGDASIASAWEPPQAKPE